MENFWFPEEQKNVSLCMSLCNSLCIHAFFSIFTTERQRLEIGIAAGCTISLILFVLVMEIILGSSTEETTLMTR